MADRYDPKLVLRPGGDRRPGDVRRGASTDDPLAELAKIVAGRPTGSTAAKTKMAAANDPAASPTGGDVLGDLETELLSDLQASFAAVREMAAPQPPTTPRPQAANQSVRPAPAPVAAERAAPSRTERPPFDLAGKGAPRPMPAAAEPPETPRIRSALREDAPISRPPTSVPSMGEQQTERTGRLNRALGVGDRPDLGTFQLRPTSAPTPPAPPPQVRQLHSRWERPEPKPTPAGANRFAPPRSAAPPSGASAFDDDDLDPFADEDFLAEADATGADDFSPEGFNPSAGDDDHEPPYEDDLASMVPQRRSRGIALVAAVIGVVLIGGVAVALFRPTATDTGTPPVIVADGQPTKITPDDTTAADADSQNKLIYDRVNSGETNANSTLVTPGNEAIAPVPNDGTTNNAISRVIIPGGPGYDAPVADEGLSLDGQPSTLPAAGEQAQSQVAANGEAIQPIGPRKVRTVIVKPDGTIVDSAAADASAPAANTPDTGGAALDANAGAAAASAATAEAAPSGDTAPGGITTGAAAPPSAALPNPPVTDDTAAIAGTGATGELAITPVPDTGGVDVAAAENPPQDTPPPPAPPEKPAASQAAAPATKTVVATANNTQPIDLTRTPMAGGATVSANGMLVQVSSQRSEDAARATYRDLQARYPSILAPYDANIQRADLPDRGTFFRVRVGPFSASDAQRLCNDLKAAGGDCILAQR